MSLTTSNVTNPDAISPPPRAARLWRLRLATAGILAVVLVAGLVVAARLWASPQRVFDRAKTALHAGDEATVRQELRHLQGVPAFAPHRRFLSGALLLRSGKFDEALQEFEFSVNHPDLQIESLILSGQAFYQSGRSGNAQQLWNRALGLQPDHVDVHRWLGVLYYDLGAMDLAILHLQKASELAPSDSRPDRLMGLINKDYERPDEAVKHYRESLRRDARQPDHESILLELAYCQIRLFDYQNALETLKQTARSSKQQLLQAECTLSMGDKSSAQVLLESALSAEPRNKEALLLKGRMELESGKFADAIKTLNDAVGYYPKDFVTRFKLVQALRRQGDAETAQQQEAIANELKELWRKFSDLHMQAMKEPRNASARQELGNLALRLDRPDLAKSWFQAVLAIEPENQQALEQLLKLK